MTPRQTIAMVTCWVITPAIGIGAAVIALPGGMSRQDAVVNAIGREQAARRMTDPAIGLFLARMKQMTATTGRRAESGLSARGRRQRAGTSECAWSWRGTQSADTQNAPFGAGPHALNQAPVPGGWLGSRSGVAAGAPASRRSGS